MQTVSLPPALAAVAQGRDHITTAEFARAMCRATQTVLKKHSLTGAGAGVRPHQRGKMLMWPLAGVARVLSSEA